MSCYVMENVLTDDMLGHLFKYILSIDIVSENNLFRHFFIGA